MENFAFDEKNEKSFSFRKFKKYEVIGEAKE